MSKKAATGAASASYNWARSKLITQASVLAKRANQRLREIDKQGLASASNAYKYVETATFDGKFWTSRVTTGEYKGNIKFNTNFRAMSDEDIQKELKQLKSFLGAKTSLTRGVGKKVEKLTKEFNKQTGTNYSTEQFSEYLTTNLVKELFNNFDSSEVIRLLSEGNNLINADKILTALVKKMKKTIAEMDWVTITDAFESWNETGTVGFTEEELEDIAKGFDEK